MNWPNTTSKYTTASADVSIAIFETRRENIMVRYVIMQYELTHTECHIQAGGKQRKPQ